MRIISLDVIYAPIFLLSDPLNKAREDLQPGPLNVTRRVGRKGRCIALQTLSQSENYGVVTAVVFLVPILGLGSEMKTADFAICYT